MKSGRQSCALAAESSHALGISRRKITHTSTSIWAMPARSPAPTALRYSVSIRPWVHAKLIRQIVLTLARTELKGGNAASLVVLPAADRRNFRADFLRTVRKLGLIRLRSLGYWSKRAAKPGATIAAGAAELCVAHDESSRRRHERLKRAISYRSPTVLRTGPIRPFAALPARAGTGRERHERSFPYSRTTGQVDPLLPFKIQPFERAGRARKRSLAEGAGLPHERPFPRDRTTQAGLGSSGWIQHDYHVFNNATGV
jgi:hypothetical protein